MNDLKFYKNLFKTLWFLPNTLLRTQSCNITQMYTIQTLHYLSNQTYDLGGVIQSMNK